MRVEDLHAELGVSLATIRRDLDELEADGVLRRVHGGAVSVDQRPVEARFDAKAAVARPGEGAHRRPRRWRSSSRARRSTSTPAPPSWSWPTCCAGRDDLTVVTNSLPAINALAGRGPHLVILGGDLRPLSQAIVGPLSRLLLEHLYVDRAFLGTFGLSLDAGLTTSDPQEAYTKELVLGRARQVVLLADAAKLGTRSFAHAGRLDQVDLLITDAPLDPTATTALDAAGVQVLVA